MSKKSKLKLPKCPQCKINEYVKETYHDCPTCSCGNIFECVKCWTEFDKNGEEL